LLYLICVATGAIHLVNAFHNWLSKRLIKKFKDSGYTAADRDIAIPEYDWKNGNPEEFYRTFVARPHPVVLRGFMKDTSLLVELGWDEVLRKYGQEDVFLTKDGLDGSDGKLNEVDNPQVYLHNSEKLFSKYPSIRLVFIILFY
jgi:hypothetical protein